MTLVPAEPRFGFPASKTAMAPASSVWIPIKSASRSQRWRSANVPPAPVVPSVGQLPLSIAGSSSQRRCVSIGAGRLVVGRLLTSVLLLSAVTSPLPRLPHAELAQVPPAKPRDYVLNPTHPQGGPKSRVFAAALGITRADWQHLRQQLLTGVRSAPAQPRGSTPWGDLHEAAFDVTGPDGRVHRVRTGWIVRPDDPSPHLTTAYVDLP